MSVLPEAHRAYWRKNLRAVLILLILWAIPSFLFGIILVEPLNTIKVAGFPLGFWFAQQGSIYIFIVLILVYSLYMDRLDREFIESNGGTTDEGDGQ